MLLHRKMCLLWILMSMKSFSFFFSLLYCKSTYWCYRAYVLTFSHHIAHMGVFTPQYLYYKVWFFMSIFPRYCLSSTVQGREGFTDISRCYLYSYEQGTQCSTFWTHLTYHFHWRTTKPLQPSSAAGCDETTSRCQAFLSIGTLKKH